MASVFLVQHVHILNEDEENVKLIGIYETEELANAAVVKAKTLPGFEDYPDGFHVDKYELNQDHWLEGFVTVIN